LLEADLGFATRDRLGDVVLPGLSVIGTFPQWLTMMKSDIYRGTLALNAASIAVVVVAGSDRAWRHFQEFSVPVVSPIDVW
jgi:hypothetical protein